MLISASVFGGTPQKAVKKAFAEADLYVSPALLKEYLMFPLNLKQKVKLTTFN